MFNAKNLLPTKSEARKLFLEVWKYLLLAAVGGVTFLVPAIRGWLAKQAQDLWMFGGQDILVRGWLIITLTSCAIFTVIQLMHWIVRAVQRGALFRSLSRNERLIVTRLAESDYGLTEGQLCDLIPVSQQHFLHFIDRLVHDLCLVERTESSSGGAFWALSDKGRNVATANNLFLRDSEMPNPAIQ